MPGRDLKKSKTASRRRLRVAVVGIGYLGKYHVEKYAANPGVEIIGLADTDVARAKEWAERVGARAHADYRDLLGGVDAVSVVVPTDRHCAVARDFLESGADVLLEKPMTTDLTEADDLIQAARVHGRVLQVGHLERFNPAFLAARGKITIPLFIEAHRLTPFRGRGTEVDVVLDLMIHDLDIILSLVGAPVEHIHAVGVPVMADKVDIANVRLRFQGGCEANLTASRISLQDQRRLRIFQPDSYLAVDYAAKKVASYRRVLDPEHQKAVISPEVIEVIPGDALEKEIGAFVHACLTRESPPVTGEDGRRALAAALAINAQIGESMKKIPSVIAYYRKKAGGE